MTMAPTPNPASTAPQLSIDTQWMGVVWLALGYATFGLAAAVAYRPSTDDPMAVLLAGLPWLLLLAMTVALAEPFVGVSRVAGLAARVAAIGSWSILTVGDDRWTIVSYALYALCFSAGRLIGVALAAIVSGVWAVAWIVDDAPAWAIIIPFAVFVVSSLISLMIYRAERVTGEQADVIRELRETQRELAEVERSKGVLEERARVAGEIHDTLAQGFASIVLLSRAAQRSGSSPDVLPAIEETAQENLQAARRLVEAIRPPELESASLADALDRQVSASLPGEIQARFRVVGEPRRLSGAVEVTMLRAAQEALLNVRAHADAGQVDVTLSYLDDVVALDVRDDGIGFVPGTVSDRGSLTGGQGLRALEQRARSMAGELTIEPNQGGGSVVSVLLPAVPG